MEGRVKPYSAEENAKVQQAISSGETAWGPVKLTVRDRTREAWKPIDTSRRGLSSFAIRKTQFSPSQPEVIGAA